MHVVRSLPSKLSRRCSFHGVDVVIVLVGSGLVAVSAAQSLLDRGYHVMLITAHAEFGFPHGGCGLWDTSMLDWPLDTLEEAVAAQVNETVTCRSQWLVKRLVHRFTAAGGRTSTRVRLQSIDNHLHATGTGTFPLDDVHHVILADQDVPEPAPGTGEPLLTFSASQTWYGAVVAEGTTVDAPHTGQRGDGSVEVWTTEQSELDAIQPFTLESMRMNWDVEEAPINAARSVLRAHAAVNDFLVSGRLGEA